MKRKKYREKEWLEKHYQEENESLREIADTCGCDPGTVLYWMEKNDIKRRERLNKDRISERCIDFLEANLLGDGFLSSKKGNPRFGSTDKNEKYAEWLKNRLKEFGLEAKVLKTRGGYFRIYTPHYLELNELRNKWYNRSKRLPTTLEPSPEKLLIWYIDDGNLRRGVTPRIGVVALKEGLNNFVKKLDFDVNMHRQEIYIDRNNRDDFWDYIMKAELDVPDCYRYKFPTR